MKNQICVSSYSLRQLLGPISGVLVFRDTRVPVAALFENLRDGATIDQFLEWFPGVTRTQVESVLDYEAQALHTIIPA